MPRKEHVVRLFVSSPSDLADERQILEDLVCEFNTSWNSELGLRFELVRWETSVLPGVGTEPQAVIDAAIGDDYDAFVGLLWKRFGTPTVAYGSGTAQEFERAFVRARNEPGFRMMVYFNDAPVSPSDIDLDQLAQVRSFRDSLSARGVLWSPYAGRVQFEQLLRLHLAKLAQEWKVRLDAGEAESHPKQSSLAPDVSGKPRAESETENEGILDLMEIIQEDMATLTSIVERITHAMTEVTSQLNSGSDLLESLRASGQTDVAGVKRAVNRVAGDLEAFARRIDVEVPELAVVFERMVKAVSSAAVIQLDVPNSENPTNEAIAAGNTLIEGIRSAKVGAEGMRASAAALPRMSKAMNNARRNAVEALDRLIGVFQREIDLTEVVVGNLRGRLK
jgi:hypothetical protein